MKWITREHPKIDRIACPWLIRRFIDPEAEIVYVPYEQVITSAKELGATPFDLPGVEFTHYGDKCTFDYFIEKFDIQDPVVHTLAPIVRGADTDQHELALECPGLWAVFCGLAHNVTDDYELLDKGMVIYDALYSWAKYHKGERHTQHTVERLLIDVYNKYLKYGDSKKVPEWAKELKALIQDQIDTNLSLNLKDVSQNLDINPSYLSREFSKYFDNLSYGEYIRKLRIEKAIGLLTSSTYSLTEIAYLTGFSDQSHFTRIFKQHTGKTPSAYKKNFNKGRLK
ncbi:chromate resistance protein ChrB domain-containing protein [Chitinophaga agri]|uniref:Helix-turn-helix domain-containing protein n=1 Tax=Chitinophaga agri TaxID=2703787 RepID=A0A6B9ZEP9_9BACT|nr:chromate resistance protein ChrB domain-containing protein [Chitinophaga agri]QHS60848.1 helix-turn-helix domain-containing protein [Chitinophaga agri]